MSDLFNNPINDYVYPGLSPCVGAYDDSYFEFLQNGRIGIITGSTLDAIVDFSDIAVMISGWSQQSKILAPGEVTFIPGLTKSLLNKKQVFLLPELSEYDPYFFTVDLSVGHYSNFSYKVINIEASANYDTNVDIQSALNIAITTSGINMSVTYDASMLSFAGTQLGYDFDISNVKLTLIDASENENSPYSDASIYELEEDKDAAVLSAKYPNGANLGVILKVSYSEDAQDVDKWIYLNHVSDYITTYEQVEAIDCSAYYDKITRRLDVGMNGSSTSEVMSAGDYLHYITENSLWKKVGDLYIWTTATDGAAGACSNKNLIDSFYLYNPQSRNIRVDYLLFI